MNDQTATHADVTESASDQSQNAGAIGPAQRDANASDASVVVIAATFTADPLQELVKFWMSAIEARLQYGWEALRS